MRGTLTGNRVLLRIEGKTVGDAVQNVDFQDDFGLQDVDGLGNAETQELVVGAIRHTINLSTYRVSGQSLIELGFVPTSDTWLTSGALEIEVTDDQGVTQEHYIGCKAASHSRTYQKHVICGGSASFRALQKL